VGLDAPLVATPRRAQHDRHGQWVADDEVSLERDVDDHVPLIPGVDVDLLRHHDVTRDLELRAVLAGRESEVEILARVERQPPDAVDVQLAAHRGAVLDVHEARGRNPRDHHVRATRDEPLARLLDDATLRVANEYVAVAGANRERLLVPVADGADIVAVDVDGHAAVGAVVDREEGPARRVLVMRRSVRRGLDEGKGEGAGEKAQHGGLLFVDHRRRLTGNHFDLKDRRTYVDLGG
jgi:hypothetical protein